MGYTNTLTQSFPYAAAAVLASRRYAAPAAKWRSRRRTALRTCIGVSRSRTKTVRRRRVSRKARNRTRKRRRAAFNMNSYSTRTLRFKNLQEVSYTWDLNSTTATTAPVRVQTMHTQWMPPPNTHELQEAIFNNYRYKRLHKYFGKITNIRLFLETTTTVKSQSVGSPAQTAPATTDIQIAELHDWVFWYWRMIVSGNNAPPAKDDESRYTKFCRKNCYSSIKSYVPFSPKDVTWASANYDTMFATTNGTAVNLDNYLKDFLKAGYFSDAPATTTMPSADLWIMPDDPYPTSFYPPVTSATTRSAKLVVLADVVSYSTWKLRCPRTTPVTSSHVPRSL